MKRAIFIILLIFALALSALAETELVYRTEDVDLHLPASWKGKVLILPTPTGAAFYQKASYDRFLEEGIPGGGFLFALDGCVNSDYQDLPSFIYLGFCEDSAMNYYIELPTDYPAYMDEAIRAEWDDMHGKLRGIAQGAVIRGSVAKPEGKRYSGTDPWGNRLTIAIDAITDGKMAWTYTEDFAGQVLSQSFQDTELVDGRAAFHVEAAIQGAEYITCDYSGTITVDNDSLTVAYTAGQMTEASSEGGSTAYHVDALEETDRTVVLRSAPVETDDAASDKANASGD